MYFGKEFIGGCPSCDGEFGMHEAGCRREQREFEEEARKQEARKRKQWPN